jgi:hypothetical protein
MFISSLIPVKRQQPMKHSMYPITYMQRIPPAVSIQKPGPGNQMIESLLTIVDKIIGTKLQSKKSSLTMSQVSQLSLIIHRHELDALHLLMKDEPRSISSSNIVKLFIDFPHGHTLLLVSGRVNDSALLLACTLPSLTRQFNASTKRWIECGPLFAAGSHDDCVVQLLPEHRVLKRTSDAAHVKTVGNDSKDILVDLGDVKIWVAMGVQTGVLESGSEKMTFVVDMMEVWGGDDTMHQSLTGR